jgi:peroxiredoxin family protein
MIHRPLPALIASSQEIGVRLIACQMVMDMMGIQPEELIVGVENAAWPPLSA